MALDKQQSKAAVGEYEVSERFSTDGSPEVQSGRKSSFLKGADPHRGELNLDPASDDMMRFTATGRPYKRDNRYQTTWAGMANAHVPQGVAGKTLPWKYTDESLISVPCLKPRAQEPAPPAGDAGDKMKKWWRRKSLTSGNSLNDPGNFMMKKVKRGDYLKHYAKDEQGNYMGTEEPAEDCILRGKDLDKYRGSDTKFRHKIVEAKEDRERLVGLVKEKDDGAIR
jgi:hypothetical protein